MERKFLKAFYKELQYLRHYFWTDLSITTIGTRHLNSNLCVTQYVTESKSFTAASAQFILEKISKGFKQIKLGNKEVNNFKSLMVDSHPNCSIFR